MADQHEYMNLEPPTQGWWRVGGGGWGGGGGGRGYSRFRLLNKLGLYFGD